MLSLDSNILENQIKLLAAERPGYGEIERLRDNFVRDFLIAPKEIEGYSLTLLNFHSKRLWMMPALRGICEAGSITQETIRFSDSMNSIGYLTIESLRDGENPFDDLDQATASLVGSLVCCWWINSHNNGNYIYSEDDLPNSQGLSPTQIRSFFRISRFLFGHLRQFASTA